MRYKFPSQLRLTAEAQFKQVYKARQKILTEMFDIYYCVNDVNRPRIGVIISKANIKNSSKRNYFKRVIREYFRLNQYRLKNNDIIIIVNKRAEGLITKEVNLFLEKKLKELIL